MTRTRISRRHPAEECRADSTKHTIVTSGGQTSYFTIIHIPIRAYRGRDDGQYMERMMERLEKGNDQAHKRQYRIVICMDGRRSDNIPWEQAGKAAMGVVKLYLRTETVKRENVVREIVVNISTKQDRLSRRPETKTYRRQI